MKEVFKVASKTRPGELAAAIAGAVREEHEVEMNTIGAGAVNQAIKAVAIAKGFLAPAGIRIVADPSFGETNNIGDNKIITTMVLEVVRI